MATGLEIFGIACNVMQTIHFAISTAALCEAVYKGGSVSPEIELHGVELTQATRSLQQSLRQTQGSTLQGDDREIERVALELLTIADKLQKELAKYGKSARGSRGRSMINIVKFVFRKSEVKNLNEKLENHQNIMETKILVRLRYLKVEFLPIIQCINLHSKRMDLIQSTISTRFDTSDNQLNNFLLHLKNGQTRLEQLVDNSTGKIQDSVREEGISTRAAVQNIVALESDLTRLHVSSELNIRQSLHATQVQKERLLESLKFPSMYERENASPISQSHEGTFEWMFMTAQKADGFVKQSGNYFGYESESESSNEDYRPEVVWDSFTDWLQSDDTFYWITGKPGSGKSSLMRFLAFDSRTKDLFQRGKSGQQTRILRTFIWMAGDPNQRSQKGVLATLLHQQLSDNSVSIDQLVGKYENKTSIVDWSLKELQDSLEYTLKQPSTSTCIFIDGLDEIDSREFGGLHGLIKLIKILCKIPGVKLCLGSRPEPILVSEFSTYPKLRLQDLTEGDMLKHVRDSLGEVHERYIGDELFEQLPRVIIERAEGVFLWVTLVTRSICDNLDSDEWETVLERVRRLPSNLSDLYNSMWNRLNKDDQELFRAESAMCFLLVLGETYVPPTVFQMMIATKSGLRRKLLAGGLEVKVDYIDAREQQFRRQIQKRCAGLLVVPGSNPGRTLDEIEHYNRVRFVHRTAHDFFLETQEGKKILNYSPVKLQELQLWVHTAQFFELSVKAHSINHEASSLLRLTLRETFNKKRDMDPKVELSLFALIRKLLERSSPWVDVLKETSLDYSIASEGYFNYIQDILTKMSKSDNRDREVISQLLGWTLRNIETRHNSFHYPISDSWFTTIELLLKSGANVNSGLRNYERSRFSHGSAFVVFLRIIDSQLSYRGPKQTYPLLQLLYTFMDSDADLKTKALLRIDGEAKIFRKFGSIVGPKNPFGILFEVEVRSLLLYVHTKLVVTLEQEHAPNPPPETRRDLEAIYNLPIKACLVYRMRASNKDRYGLAGLEAFDNTAYTAHIFEELNKLTYPALEYDLVTKEELLLKVEGLPPDQALSHAEVWLWLVEKGFISSETKNLPQFCSMEELLFGVSYDYADPSIMIDFDWSFIPEYDELVTVVNEFFRQDRT